LATLKYREVGIFLPYLPQCLRCLKRGENEVADAISLLDGLSGEQRAAVTSKKPYVRVIAGAGAGKTETLTRRVAYLLLVERVEPSSIVAFTFTEKAALSMKSRIYRYISDLNGPTSRLGEMYIGTIHSYAKRLLDDHPKYGNYELIDENKEVAFLSSHGWDLFQGPGRIRRMAEFLCTFRMTLDEMLSDKSLEAGAPAFFRLKAKYEAKLDQHRLLTFGTSIRLAVEVLREHPAAGVKYLFIDEYQDINRAQDEMIKLIGRGASVFVVGDPRQSIYQWRGSDERYFETFSETFAPSETVEIAENRRSSQSVVKAANAFASGFAVKCSPMVATRGDDGLACLREFADASAEARWVADQVEALVSVGLRYSDIGILMRSVRNYAGPIIGELKRRSVPYSLGGGIGLFRRDEVQAMARIFSWLADGGLWPAEERVRDGMLEGESLLRSGLEFWAAATRRIPADAEGALRGIRGALYAGGSQEGVAAGGMQRHYANYTQLYHAILNALAFKSLDYLDPNDAAVMANLGRFHVLLTDYESESRRNGGRPSWRSALRGLNWFMRTYAASAYEEQPVDDVRGVDAVKVMTVHQAKGLEWPAVFVMGVAKDLFPLPVERWASWRAEGEQWMGVPRTLFEAKRYEGSTDEEMRLFYVAMTRARDVLVITGAAGDGGARSEFVDAIKWHLDRVDDLKKAMGLKKVQIRSPPRTEEMQSFAAGDLIRYSICPHMYLLGHVWGYQPELDVAIGFGNGLHYCLKRAAEAAKGGRDPVEAVRDAVDSSFHVPFADWRAAETLRDSARGMLEGFAAAHGRDLQAIEEAEYRIEYPMENATVTGRVDVIMREGGVREVREYKTSDEVVTPEELAVQIRIYAMGLEGVGKPVGRASAAYLKEGRVDPVGIGREELDAAKRVVGRCVRGIVGREFAPDGAMLTTNHEKIRMGKPTSCRRCDQVNLCRWRSSKLMLPLAYIPSPITTPSKDVV
jgi:DNA helicase-2/ATP-dependent DNA helicase PcrA